MKRPTAKKLKITIVNTDTYYEEVLPDDEKIIHQTKEWFFSDGHLTDEDWHHIKSRKSYVLFISVSNKVFKLRNYRNQKVTNKNILERVRELLKTSTDHYLQKIKDAGTSLEHFEVME